MSYSMNALYREVGISKQAVAQYERRQLVFHSQLTQLMAEADELREEHPGCGVKKMYETLNPDFIGRDRFIEVMMELGYRVRRKKNYRKTTSSTAKYYPNLIKGMEVNGPCQLWQSDTTYIQVGDRFYYATFIIDVYTKKIVGYKVADNLRATANVAALKMALKHHPAPKIHHSDRGLQYCSATYQSGLKANGIKPSMTDGYDCYQNAMAERINGILKQEFLINRCNTGKELELLIKESIDTYNNHRPHLSLQMRTPNFIHEKTCEENSTGLLNNYT